MTMRSKRRPSSISSRGATRRRCRVSSCSFFLPRFHDYANIGFGTISTEALENATQEQRKQLADKMRQEVQMAAAGQNAAAIHNLDDDQLLEIVK